MNKAATSHEKLVRAATELVFEEGAKKLSIRSLAEKCKISVGCVYGYFPSKADLLFAVLENYWKSVFHTGLCQVEQGTPFVNYAALFYESLSGRMEEFHKVFSAQLELLQQDERKKGKAMEQAYFAHIRKGFSMVLDQDQTISPTVWSDVFSKEKFVSFFVSNLLYSLSNGTGDGPFLQEAVIRLLYKNQTKSEEEGC